jgi:O-antigen/teichoic acid export membrane protein
VSRLGALGRQSAVYGIGSVIQRFIGIPLIYVYTHHMSRSEYGYADYVIAAVTLGISLFGLGLQNAMFRFAFDHEPGRERDRVIATAARALLPCVLAIVAVGAVATAVVPGVSGFPASLVAVGAAGLVVSILYDLVSGIYRIAQEPIRYLRLSAVNVAVTVAVSLVLVTVFDLQALGLLVGTFSGTFVALAVGAVQKRDVLRLAPDRTLVRPLLSFGLPLVPSRAAIWVLNLADRAFVEGFLGATVLGTFSAGAKLAQVIAFFTTILQLSWPAFAYSIKDDGEARTVYADVLRVWFLIVGWAVVVLAVARFQIADLMLPPRWHDAVGVIPIYALGLAIYGAYYVVSVAVGRVKETRLNVVVTGVAAVVNVAATLALIPWLGMEGAAWANVIAYVVMLGGMILRARRVFPVPYELGRIGAICLAGGALVALSSLVPAHGGAGIALRTLIVLAFPPAVLAVGGIRRSEAARLLRGGLPRGLRPGRG